MWVAGAFATTSTAVLLALVSASAMHWCLLIVAIGGAAIRAGFLFGEAACVKRHLIGGVLILIVLAIDTGSRFATARTAAQAM